MTHTTQHAAEQAAEALWATDRASKALGMAIASVAPGVAHLTMTVRRDMTNGHGICHGGFIFLLADSAFAFACNSHGHATVASGVSIEFLAPAHLDDELTAVAQERWLKGRIGIYDMVVQRADGTVIAHARGRSHRLATPPAGTRSKE